MSAPLHGAYALARAGYSITANYVPVEGGCSCGKRTCKKPGKHPRGGHTNSTTDLQTILQWSKRDKRGMNVGIDLQTSDLVDISADSTAWEAEFQRRGLPDGALVWQSGSGPGHIHHVYRRPPDWPQTKTNKPNEYDVMATGMAVAPPSVSEKGPYTWISPIIPRDQLPEAPAWARELLPEKELETTRGRPATRRTAPSDEPGDADDEPWIRGMDPDLWRGQRRTTLVEMPPEEVDGPPTSTGTPDATDRSATLWHIACDAKEHGASEALIAAILEDRDAALGFNKYTSRPEMYRRQARKVIEREKRPAGTLTRAGQPLTDPITTTPSTPPDERAELRRAFLEQKARRRRQNYATMLRRDWLLRRLLRDPNLTDGEKVLTLQLHFATQDWAQRPAPTQNQFEKPTPISEHRFYLRKHAEQWNTSRATLATRLDSLAAKTGAYGLRERSSKGPLINPDTGQAYTDRAGKKVIRYDTAVYVSPRAAGVDFLEAVVNRTYAPDAPRSATRQKKKPRGRYCQDHPHAELIAETTTTYRCSVCKQVVDQRVHDRRVDPVVTDAPRPKFGPPQVEGKWPKVGHSRDGSGWSEFARQDSRSTAQNPAAQDVSASTRWVSVFAEAGGQTLTGPTLRFVRDAGGDHEPPPHPPRELLDDLAAVEDDAAVTGRRPGEAAS